MVVVTWTETAEARILTTLFTNHTSKEMTSAEGQQVIAEECGFPVAEYSNRSQETAFSNTFAKLLDIRGRVDSIADKFPSHEAQFHKSAQLLKRYRRASSLPEMGIAYTFIESALAPRWNESLKLELHTIATFFKNTDYFLSYTNKQADQINTDFEQAFYPKVRALCTTCNTANILARQIVEHLCISGLVGYYDKEQIERGDEVRSEIVRGAGSALVFLQVVSAAMLIDDDENNWCFQEYTAYKKRDLSAYKLPEERARLLIFLIAETMREGRPADAVKPSVDIREAYKQWHNDMARLATEYLEYTSCLNLRQQIQSLARQIGKFKDSVFEMMVPGEFAID